MHHLSPVHGRSPATKRQVEEQKGCDRAELLHRHLSEQVPDLRDRRGKLFRPHSEQHPEWCAHAGRDIDGAAETSQRQIGTTGEAAGDLGANEEDEKQEAEDEGEKEALWAAAAAAAFSGRLVHALKRAIPCMPRP